MARLTVIRISVIFCVFFYKWPTVSIRPLNTFYKFHSHSIYVQSVPKNFIYQVYEYVRNYHRSLRRNANETFEIKWLLKDNMHMFDHLRSLYCTVSFCERSCEQRLFNVERHALLTI